MKVADLLQQPGKWNKQLIQENFLSPDAELIFTIPISPFSHEDSWLWHYSKNGSYSVKSGYNLAVSTVEDGPSSSSEVLAVWWKGYWATKIPRKMVIFGWRGYHQILPTIKGLWYGKITKHSNCPLCGYGEDSNAHAVFWCPFSQEVWVFMEFQFLMGHKEDISFKDVLLYATELLGKEDFAKMMITAWGIWVERNKKTHGHQQRTSQQIKEWVTSYYEEVKNIITVDNGVILPKESSRDEHSGAEIQELTLFVDASIPTTSHKVGLGAVI